ncbi:hypothetical protein PF007_g2488 [Phytophthora fragariae]|uniref:Uncharacterized protein n=1 Tax=Phytophthora fragariae TaxID=53985 RepID=A0A6A3FTD4_9STRA|nr:hypothetical protein PF009_g2701 [Phytophthora fragariae]KAE9135641.1 hypothetical protein PF007_g2488 [Phytophthora fragariae]KAE9326751.1 hypothetical protein PF001_g2280 [Phytophthora fragariae]
MTPAGETVGDVSSRRRSWRRGYGPAVARRSLRAIRPSRAGRRGVGDGSRGRGDGGSSSKAGDDVVGLRGFRVGGGVAGVAGAVSDAVGALGAEVPAVEAFVGGGFDTSFGVRRPCWGDIQGGVDVPVDLVLPGEMDFALSLLVLGHRLAARSLLHSTSPGCIVRSSARRSVRGEPLLRVFIEDVSIVSTKPLVVSGLTRPAAGSDVDRFSRGRHFSKVRG